MVLHVSCLALGIRGRVLSLELAEDRLVRLFENVSEHIDAAAVGHRNAHFSRTCVRSGFYQGVEHRHHHVGSFDREALVPLIHAAEESLKAVDLGEPFEDRLLFVSAERLMDTAAFYLVTKPLTLLSRAEVIELEPYVARIE